MQGTLERRHAAIAASEFREHLPFGQLGTPIEARVQVKGTLSWLARELALVGGGAHANVPNLALGRHELAEAEPLFWIVGVGAAVPLGAVLVNDLRRRAPATALRNFGNAVSAVRHRRTGIGRRIEEGERGSE